VRQHIRVRTCACIDDTYVRAYVRAHWLRAQYVRVRAYARTRAYARAYVRTLLRARAYVRITHARAQHACVRITYVRARTCACAHIPRVRVLQVRIITACGRSRRYEAA
jgi:hypothetical protein